MERDLAHAQDNLVFGSGELPVMRVHFEVPGKKFPEQLNAAFASRDQACRALGLGAGRSGHVAIPEFSSFRVWCMSCSTRLRCRSESARLSLTRATLSSNAS